MAPSIPYPAAKISPPGYVLIGFRLFLMLLLLIVCVPLHYLWKLLGLDRMWPRVFLTCVGAVAGIHLRRRGKRVPGALLLANHVTWMDIPVLAQAANSAFVAHDGLAQFGLLKWLCEMNETVFVARHDRSSVGAQKEAVRAAMNHGGTLTLFPEDARASNANVFHLLPGVLELTQVLARHAQRELRRQRRAAARGHTARTRWRPPARSICYHRIRRRPSSRR